MSMHAAKVVDLCTLPKHYVVSKCMDCHIVVGGYLGFQFFEHEGQRGLEVFVCHDDEAHSIARVPAKLIPQVGGESGHSTAASGA